MHEVRQQLRCHAMPCQPNEPCAPLLQLYDREGEEGLKKKGQQGGGQGDIFSSMFGGKCRCAMVALTQTITSCP